MHSPKRLPFLTFSAKYFLCLLLLRLAIFFFWVDYQKKGRRAVAKNKISFYLSFCSDFAVAPDEVKITGPEEAKAGDSLDFKCETSNSNPPATIQWVVDGRTVHATFDHTVRRSPFPKQYSCRGSQFILYWMMFSFPITYFHHGIANHLYACLLYIYAELCIGFCKQEVSDVS